METPAGEAEDEFGVRLEWPIDPVAGTPLGTPSTSDADQADDDESDVPTPADYAPAPRREVEGGSSGGSGGMAPVLERIASDGAEGLSSGLAAIAARVDVLAATTITFREEVARRIAGYADQLRTSLGDATADAARRYEGERREIQELRAEVSDGRQATQRVSAALDEVAAEMSRRLGELSEAVKGVAEVVDNLRRRTPVRPRQSGSLSEEEIQAVAEAVGRVLNGEGGEAPAASRRRRT